LKFRGLDQNPVDGIPSLNLNAEPENPPILDLNAHAELEDMVIDPQIPPLQQEMFIELNDLLNQVNEDEEDAQPAENEAGLLQENVPNFAINLADLEVNIPALHEPAVNVFPSEIQENDLMNEEEIQQQIADEAAQKNAIVQQNMQVGLALVDNTPPPNLPYPKKFADIDCLLGPLSNKTDAAHNLYSPWAKLFKPVSLDAAPSCVILFEWAKFFAALLLSLGHFSRAKEILQSDALLSCLDNGRGLEFSLPNKCPSKKAPSCTLLQVQPEESTFDSTEAPPLDEDTDNGKKKVTVKRDNKKKTFLVESEVRRSPRLKASRMGFKGQVCKSKHCVGCNSKPSTLSNKAIKSICSSLCDIDASCISDKALGTLKKAGAPRKDKDADV
jgi:hypothetical protein